MINKKVYFYDSVNNLACTGKIENIRMSQQDIVLGVSYKNEMTKLFTHRTFSISEINDTVFLDIEKAKKAVNREFD